MSIRKGNKQIAGNYLNVNFTNLTQEVEDKVNEITTVGNAQVNNVNTTATDKINQMDTILTNIIDVSDEKIESINTTATNAVNTVNSTTTEAVNTVNSTTTNAVKTVNSTANTATDKITAMTNAIKQIVQSVGVSVIGAERLWRGSTPPLDHLIEQGQLVSRTDYKDLYDWAVENNLVVSDAIWTSDKKYGFYSDGDGSTTFRLPDMRGYDLVGYDSTHHTELGVHQDDTIPNITGTLNICGTNNSTPFSSTTADGVFQVNKKTSTSYPITGSTQLTPDLVENIDLDISRQVKTGDRVQPRCIPVNFIVCYKNIYEDLNV